MSCILSFCFGMMRLILSAPLLLVAHASVALGQYRTGETDWTVYSRVDSAVQMYKVDKVSGPVVYGQERMFINGKSVLGVTKWNFDCKGNIMHGQYATWLKRGNLWVGERNGTNTPANPTVEETFNRFCRHASLR